MDVPHLKFKQTRATGTQADGPRRSLADAMHRRRFCLRFSGMVPTVRAGERRGVVRLETRVRLRRTKTLRGVPRPSLACPPDDSGLLEFVSLLRLSEFRARCSNEPGQMVAVPQFSPGW